MRLRRFFEATSRHRRVIVTAELVLAIGLVAATATRRELVLAVVPWTLVVAVIGLVLCVATQRHRPAELTAQPDASVFDTPVSPLYTYLFTAYSAITASSISSNLRDIVEGKVLLPLSVAIVVLHAALLVVTF